jgi:hypothetical protein
VILTAIVKCHFRRFVLDIFHSLKAIVVYFHLLWPQRQEDWYTQPEGARQASYIAATIMVMDEDRGRDPSGH